MTLTDARSWVRQFARNGADSTMYTDADVDRAIRLVGERFCRVTKLVRSTGTVAVSADVATFSATGITTFRADRLLDAWADGVEAALRPSTYDTCRRKGVAEPSTGEPELLGFQDGTNGVVWPIPDDAYVLHLRHANPLTTWTVGTTASASVTLNIPEDYLPAVLSYGVPAVLQHNEPEHQYASASWQKYLEAEAEARAAAGRLAARSAERERVGD